MLDFQFPGETVLLAVEAVDQIEKHTNSRAGGDDAEGEKAGEK
jgi:hypothetical protein